MDRGRRAMGRGSEEAEPKGGGRGARRDWFKNSNGGGRKIDTDGQYGLDAGGDPEAPHSRTAL